MSEKQQRSQFAASCEVSERVLVKFIHAFLALYASAVYNKRYLRGFMNELFCYYATVANVFGKCYNRTIVYVYKVMFE